MRLFLKFQPFCIIKSCQTETSLVVEWLRTHLVKKKKNQEPTFQCRWHGFDPWSGNRDPICHRVTAHEPQPESPYTTAKGPEWCNYNSHATTKTHCSQINKLIELPDGREEDQHLGLLSAFSVSCPYWAVNFSMKGHQKRLKCYDLRSEMNLVPHIHCHLKDAHD